MSSPAYAQEEEEDAGVEVDELEDLGFECERVTCAGCARLFKATQSMIILKNIKGEAVKYCQNCLVDGTAAAKQKDVDEVLGAPTVMMAVCAGCKGQKTIKFSIETNRDTFSYCAVCYAARRHDTVFATDVPHPCIVCSDPAVKEWTSSVNFINLPHQPVFAKATCSEVCNRTIQCMTEQCLGETLVTACLTCRAPLPVKARLRCTQCQTAYYCGKKCQQADWRRHKKECNVTPVAAASEAEPEAAPAAASEAAPETASEAAPDAN
jgi:hypothetical protein